MSEEQYYIRDVTVWPPSGFVYTDEDTKQVISAGSFNELVQAVVNHRRHNGLEIDAKIVDAIHAYICKVNNNNPCAKGTRGLGDLVHAIAQPIAWAIDKTLGTNVQGCWSCSGRRQALNEAVPFNK
jgi:hypothetical protein